MGQEGGTGGEKARSCFLTSGLKGNLDRDLKMPKVGPKPGKQDQASCTEEVGRDSRLVLKFLPLSNFEVTGNLTSLSSFVKLRKQQNLPPRILMSFN